MYNNLSDINIILDNEQEKLMKSFEQIFLMYNHDVNLISKNDEKYLFEKHIYDSLALNLFIKEKKEIKTIMDIGTGGGFPSLPLAVYYGDINITAIDSIKKKINIVDKIAQELNLKNITAINSRAENLPGTMRDSFDMVVSRAMAELRIILEYAVPYVKVGGYFVAYKSIKAEDELKNASNALKMLNTKLIDKIGYKLPLEDSPNRVLLVFKKLKPASALYPRKNGKIIKNPL